MKFQFQQGSQPKVNAHDRQRQQQLEQQRLQQQFQFQQYSQPQISQQQQQGPSEGGDNPGTGDSGEPVSTGGDDVTRIKGALDKEREQRKEIEKQARQLAAQLEAFKGIDPEKAKQAEQILKDMEERGQWESRIKNEVESSYQPKIAELEKARTAAEQRLIDFQTDSALEREFNKSGGFAGEYPAIAPALRNRVQLDPTTGQVKVLDEHGKQMYVKGEPATVSQLIAELKTNQLWFARHFKGQEAGGAGINGSSKYGGTVDPSTKDLPAWKRVELAREAQG